MLQPARDLKFPPRLVVGVEGAPFTGKTHLIFTMPKPLFIFNLDYGLEGMMDKFDLSDVQIANYALKKAALTSASAQEASKEVARSFRTDYLNALKTKKRASFAHDTSTEFWKFFRFGDLGKLKQVPPLRYDRVNMIWTDLMNEVYHTPHNLMLIHRVKDKYREEVSETGVKISTKIDGEIERDAFKNVEYIVQVFIRTMRKDRKGKRPLFGFAVTKCRQRASLVGEEFWGEMATFPYLAMSVFPKTNPEDWGME